MEEGRRDHLDAAAVLDAIEEEVVPLYYARNASGLASEWVRRCRHAMASVIPRFNMRRTVRDYAAGMYGPAATHGRQLLESAAAGAVALAGWKARIRERWSGVQIVSVNDEPRGTDPTAPLKLRAVLRLGGLSPGDLRVEFKARRLLPEAPFDAAPLCSFGHGTPAGHWRALFTPSGSADADGGAVFEVAAVPPGTGQYQLEVRVYPWHPLLSHPLEMGLMKSL
jgi:starch phosphorylase